MVSPLCSDRFKNSNTKQLETILLYCVVGLTFRGVNIILLNAKQRYGYFLRLRD